MQRLRARIDRVGDGHVDLTFFTTRDGHNWQNVGNWTVGREWYDACAFAGAPVGSKVEVEIGLVATVTT